MPENIQAEIIQEGDSGSFELAGMVDVDTVAEYRDSLVGMISVVKSEKIEIKLGNIEIQGSAVIALLISILRESRSRGKNLVFRNCSEKLHAIASACGVDEILPLH